MTANGNGNGKLPAPLRRARAIEKAERRLERLRAMARPVQEQAWGPMDWWTPWYDLLSRWQYGFEFGGWGYPGTGARRHGRNFPFFQSEAELNLLRAPARFLATEDDYAIGALEAVCSYVVGPGCRHRVAVRADVVDAEDKAFAKKVAAVLQIVLEDHHKRNQWHGGEQPPIEDQFCHDSRMDGEAILLHFPQRDGTTQLRFVDPERLTQPPGESFEEWGWGIRTEPDDPGNPLAYYVYFGDNPTDGEEFAPDAVTMYKTNVGRNIKRGLTDFFGSTGERLRLASRLCGNMLEGAAQQAAIAYVRQHDTATKTQVDTFASGQSSAAGYQRTNPLTGATENVVQVRPGQQLDIPKGLNFVPPPSAQNGMAHIEILQAGLRSLGRRWQFPEGMISGDASNNNFASALVAEAPFTRYVKRRQPAYAECFRRSGEFALRHYCETVGLDVGGRVLRWDEVRRLVELQVTAPSPEVRNKAEEATTNTTYLEKGIKSPQKVAAELDLDYDQMTSESAEHRRRTAATQPGDAVPVVAALQAQVYAGQLPRGAAVVNVMTFFGLDQKAAEALFPEAKPVKLTPDDKPPQQAPAGGGGGDPFDQLGEQRRLRENFTGVKADSLGREYYYVNGKRTTRAHLASVAPEAVKAAETPGDSTTRPPPKKRIFQRGEEIAKAAHAQLSGAMGALQSGSMTPDQAESRVLAAGARAEQEVEKNFRGRWPAFRDRMAAQFGEAALASDEWDAVKSEFRKGMEEATSWVQGMTADVRQAVKHFGEKGSYPPGTRQALNDAHYGLVQSHHDFTARLGDAVDALAAAHGPKRESVAAGWRQALEDCGLVPLRESGFTGVLTDASGREMHYVDGVHVSGAELAKAAPKAAQAASEPGDSGKRPTPESMREGLKKQLDAGVNELDFEPLGMRITKLPKANKSRPAEEVDIPIEQLWGTEHQGGAERDRALAYADPKHPAAALPVVVVKDAAGRLILSDGNHRLAGAILRGDKMIRAKVYPAFFAGEGAAP